MSALEVVTLLIPVMVWPCLLGIWQIIQKAKLEARVKQLETRLKYIELFMGVALGNRRNRQ